MIGHDEDYNNFHYEIFQLASFEKTMNTNTLF